MKNLQAVKMMGSGMTKRYGTRPGRSIDHPAFTIRASAGGMEPGGFVFSDGRTIQKMTPEQAAVLQSYPTPNEGVTMTTQYADHTVLDLFAGTGVGVALQQIGATELGVEIMPEAIQTRTNNGMATIWENVWEPNGGSQWQDADTIWASPPCQTFSMAGGGAGRRALDQVLAEIDTFNWQHDTLESLRTQALAIGDERIGLVLTPLWYAGYMMPQTILLEQVPPVLPVWERMAVELEKWGYSTWTGILHAEQYGVPQTRKRAILMAKRNGFSVVPPKPTHSKYHTTNPTKLDEGVEKWVSMYEALGGHEGEILQSNYGSGGDPAARGERPVGAPAPTVTSKADRNKWVRPEIEAWRWKDKPATTVAGDPRITSREHHYEGEQNSTSLRLTKDEAQALQSYPNGFEFAGNKGNQFQQIGNAVPPLLAKAIFEEAWK